MREVVWLAVVCFGACLPPPSPADAGVSFAQGEGASATVLLGTIDRGFGQAGLSLWALLSDEDAASWVGEVLDDRDEVLTTLTYGTPDGTHAATAWWPSVPAAYGVHYTVRFFENGGRELRVKTTLAPTSGLTAPEVTLSADRLRLEWGGVPGAKAYDCSPQPGVVGEHVLTPGCALPPGQTSVMVHAFNLDLAAPVVAAELPPSFDVSEARYAYGVSSSGASVRAALGSIQYTPGAAGFAALVSVQMADGSPPSVPWDLEVRGPAFGATGALSGTQLAGTDRLILWEYAAAPLEGLYEVHARSGAETASFSLRAPGVAPMAEVSGLTVERRGAGGAVVTWQPVPVARGYYVSAWARDTGTLLASSWVTNLALTFPPGTFAAGQSCDVYVAASSADPSLGAPLPSAISLSENTYRPVNFVAE